LQPVLDLQAKELLHTIYRAELSFLGSTKRSISIFACSLDVIANMLSDFLSVVTFLFKKRKGLIL
jgi:hypothetical protein